MKTFIRTLHRNDQGQILVLTVLCMSVLLGFMALAIDVGQLLYSKRQLQAAADAAAIAGALEIAQCASTTNCAAMQAAAKSAITENGYATPALVTQCAANTNTGLTLILNNGPCALGSSDPKNGNASYVEALVTLQQPMLFARILGLDSVRLTARAEAGKGDATYCVHVINSSASQALLMNSNANLTASCGVIVDSSSSTSMLINSGASLISTANNTHGGTLINGSPTISPSIVTGVAVQADPLASLPTPTVGSCGTTTSSPYTGSKYQLNVNSGVTATFNPGVYCGGINLNSNATATFNSGTYIFQGSVNVNSGASITGNGVTIYMDSGQFIMNSGSSANLVAPTTGTYAGVLIYQSKSDTNQLILNGSSTSVWQGAIYLPTANLTLNSGSNLAAYTILDVNTLTINSGANFTVGSDYSSLPGGSPIGGSSAGAVLTE